jgi:hypothetical protein
VHYLEHVLARQRPNSHRPRRVELLAEGRSQAGTLHDRLGELGVGITGRSGYVKSIPNRSSSIGQWTRG